MLVRLMDVNRRQGRPQGGQVGVGRRHKSVNGSKERGFWSMQGEERPVAKQEDGGRQQGTQADRQTSRQRGSSERNEEAREALGISQYGKEIGRAAIESGRANEWRRRKQWGEPGVARCMRVRQKQRAPGTGKKQATSSVRCRRGGRVENFYFTHHAAMCILRMRDAHIRGFVQPVAGSRRFAGRETWSKPPRRQCISKSSRVAKHFRTVTGG